MMWECTGHNCPQLHAIQSLIYTIYLSIVLFTGAKRLENTPKYVFTLGCLQTFGCPEINVECYMYFCFCSVTLKNIKKQTHFVKKETE